MAHVAVSAGMDFATGTRQSLLTMVPTIDRPACAPTGFTFTPASQMRSPIQSVALGMATVIPAFVGVLLAVIARTCSASEVKMRRARDAAAASGGRHWRRCMAVRLGGEGQCPLRPEPVVAQPG